MNVRMWLMVGVYGCQASCSFADMDGLLADDWWYINYRIVCGGGGRDTLQLSED
jgi:hypothetical protein